MRPTFLIMAAGMGSRYGGLKQLDGVGPHGEVIMDYSIYDALRAGFGKVVFVVRRSFEKEFAEFVTRFHGKVPYEIVLQELEFVPTGCTYSPEREKPWGTNHAIMMGESVIHEPFAVINADDYYGVDSFRVLANHLQTLSDKENKYCMVGFQVGNTLSETGSVSRGVCAVNDDNYLTSIEEHSKIQRDNNKIFATNEKNKIVELADNTPVSMNMWGFTPDYFLHSKRMFKEFLQANGQNPKSEFYIPFAVNELIQSNSVTVNVLGTSSQWFGVTYKEDRPMVAQRLQELHNEKIYPEKLF